MILPLLKSKTGLRKEDGILYFDLETSHCLVAAWGTGKTFISSEQILKDRKILTISYMWEGESRPTSLVLDLNKHDIYKFDDDADKEMIIKFMEQVEKAKLLVAHNGRKFDIARLRARLVKYDLPDIAGIPLDDSYQFTRNIDFTSHKLDFICKILGLGKKKKTSLDLWINIFFRKDKKALKYMAEYNRHDVVLLAKAYRKLRKYGQSHLNLAVSRENPNICPKCGSKLWKKGFKISGIAKYQRYQCANLSCKHVCRDGVNLLLQQPKNFPRSFTKLT